MISATTYTALLQREYTLTPKESFVTYLRLAGDLRNGMADSHSAMEARQIGNKDIYMCILNLYVGDFERNIDIFLRSTWHNYGVSPRYDAATSTRYYSDGSSISAGLQNYWMTERK